MDGPRRRGGDSTDREPDAYRDVNTGKIRAGVFSPQWRKNLFWIAAFDVVLWVFGAAAFLGGGDRKDNNWNNGIPSCVWDGDGGTVLAYIHHLIRAVFVLAWITYQRNCICRMHQCCDSYTRCQVLTRSCFLVILILQLIADTVLMLVWASDHKTGRMTTYNFGPLNNLPLYVPRCNGERLASFIWLAFCMWLVTLAYLRYIVADLQLCGNMLRNKHCCRQFRLVEDQRNAHALQWCCVCMYSPEVDEDDERERLPVITGQDDDDVMNEDDNVQGGGSTVPASGNVV